MVYTIHQSILYQPEKPKTNKPTLTELSSDVGSNKADNKDCMNACIFCIKEYKAQIKSHTNNILCYII